MYRVSQLESRCSLMFYEDPLIPDNFDSMAWVAQKIRIPLATGEADSHNTGIRFGKTSGTGLPAREHL